MLEKEYLGGALPDGPAPVIPPAGDRDHIGVHRQRDGRYYVGVAPSVGRTSGTLLWQVADLAEAYGSGRVRTTAEQKLLILDVPEDRVTELADELAARDLLVAPSAFRRGTMACTGIEFCKLAIVETKQRAADLHTASSSGGCPTSTPRSASTSTAAPTPAPGSRSPTSGSRARSWTATRASRCTWAARSGPTRRSAASCAG